MTLTAAVASDIHDDLEALVGFTDHAKRSRAEVLLLLGDLSQLPYTAEHRATRDQALPSNPEYQRFTQLLEQKKASAADGRMQLTDADLQHWLRVVQGPEYQEFIRSKRAHNGSMLRQMKTILDGAGMPYFVIPGNYDPGGNDPTFREVFGEHDLHSMGINFSTPAARTSPLSIPGATFKLFGYGGTPATDPQPGHLQELYNLGEMVVFDHDELLGALTAFKPEVTMIHNPPQGLCDVIHDGRSVGTPASRKYVEQHSPKLMLNGHIHESGPNGNNPKGVRGVAAYDNPTTKARTYVVNPGNLGRAPSIDPATLQAIDHYDFGTFAYVEMEADGTPLRLVQYTLQAGQNVGPVREMADRKLYTNHARIREGLQKLGNISI